MCSLIRTHLRYASRIGALDGRRSYPVEDQFQELLLHAPAPGTAVADGTPIEPEATVFPPKTGGVHEDLRLPTGSSG